MIKKLFLVVSLTLLTPAVISCNSPRESSTPEKTIETGVKKGNLFLVANGEDFIREGFVSKDGWRLDFDRLHATGAGLAEGKGERASPHNQLRADDSRLGTTRRLAGRQEVGCDPFQLGAARPQIHGAEWSESRRSLACVPDGPGRKPGHLRPVSA